MTVPVTMTCVSVPRDLPRVVVTASSDKSITVAWELMAPDRARGVITTYRLIYRERGHAAQHIMEMTTPAREYTITGRLLVSLVIMLCLFYPLS